MSPRRRRFLEKLRSLYLWHRYAGLAVAVLAAWLAVSGILLNHTEDFDLSDSYVAQDWLLEAYAIEPATDLEGYFVAGHWVASSGELTYIDRQRLRTESQLRGAAETPFGFVLAFRNQLQIYTPEAVLVESLPFTASAAPITGIASTGDGRVVVTTSSGRFLSDEQLMEFSRIQGNFETREADRRPLPETLAGRVATDIRHHTLSWERVLLDAHSGRILGRAGVWIIDIAGLLVLLLAISGVVIWYKRRMKMKRHQQGG